MLSQSGCFLEVFKLRAGKAALAHCPVHKDSAGIL